MCWELIFKIINVLGTFAIVIALFVAIRAMNITKKEIETRQRPYIYAAEFSIRVFWKSPSGEELKEFVFNTNKYEVNKIEEIQLEIKLKNVGQIPGVLKNVKIERILGNAHREEQVQYMPLVVYPGEKEGLFAPKIHGNTARKIIAGEIKYKIKIWLSYQPLGDEKKEPYISTRTISYDLSMPRKIRYVSFGDTS